MALKRGVWPALGVLIALAALLSLVGVRREAPVALPAGLAAADLIRGHAEVSDGDTLRIGAVRIRLFGIDAPERRQTCDSGAKGSWNCGVAASERLAALIGYAVVTCAPRDRDRYGRLVAACRAGGVDLGERLVAEGLARAYTRFGDDYARVEARAKTERVGLWHGPAAAPWDYRAERRAASVKPPPSPDCTIKGNINTAGARVYHLPGSRDYARTRIDPSRGEAWFCAVAEAEAAGFRAARK